MKSFTHHRKFLGFLVSGFLLTAARSHAANLSLGADYLLRGVSVTERDKNFKKNAYYDQRLQGYLTTDLSKDVEATIRVQSITPWGLEGSTTPATRYPNGNGDLWVQNAFIRLPNIWNNRIIVTAGRQPIVWGDGKILSDDELGFNALRAQVKSPWRRIPFDIDGFTAKINEGLTNPGDKDLNGAMLSFDSRVFHWEVMGLWEKADGNIQYEAGASTIAFAATKVERTIYGTRAITRLKDAYLKGEYYVQSGKVKHANEIEGETKLGGEGYVLGLGGKQNTSKFGRFGAVLEYCVGSGDDATTPGEDEAFRPSYSSRWSGLERRGYGQYFASTFSDAYSPTQPFGDASASNDGLPDGTSGIQTIHFGIESTPWSQWTFIFDYFQYKAQKNVAGNKELGTEFDYGFVYRYSGLVTVRGMTSSFTPGQAYKDSTGVIEDTSRNGKNSSIEIEIKF